MGLWHMPLPSGWSTGPRPSQTVSSPCQVLTRYREQPCAPQHCRQVLQTGVVNLVCCLCTYWLLAIFPSVHCSAQRATELGNVPWEHYTATQNGRLAEHS
jgi:hypothetical protein